MNAQLKTTPLVRRVLVVAAAVVLLVGGALVYQRVTAEPEYTSSVTFFMSTTSAVDGPSEPAADLEQRIASVKSLLTSEALAEKIIVATGLDMSVQQVQSEITGTVDDNTVLLTATVTDPSAERSLVIAQAIAAHLEPVVDQTDPAGAANRVLRMITSPSLDTDPA